MSKENRERETGQPTLTLTHTHNTPLTGSPGTWRAVAARHTAARRSDPVWGVGVVAVVAPSLVDAAGGSIVLSKQLPCGTAAGVCGAWGGGASKRKTRIGETVSTEFVFSLFPRRLFHPLASTPHAHTHTQCSAVPCPSWSAP